MLVTFTTPAYANITMFGDVALQLLKMMGKSTSVPGALLAEDIPAALEKLEAAVDADRLAQEPGQTEMDEDGEAPVSLSNRALPLIELLKAAAQANRNVMWDSGS
jgi:hypothetical protein